MEMMTDDSCYLNDGESDKTFSKRNSEYSFKSNLSPFTHTDLGSINQYEEYSDSYIDEVLEIAKQTTTQTKGNPIKVCTDIIPECAELVQKCTDTVPECDKIVHKYTGIVPECANIISECTNLKKYRKVRECTEEDDECFDDTLSELLESITKDTVYFSDELDLFNYTSKWLIERKYQPLQNACVLSHVRFGLMKDVDILQIFRRDDMLDNNIGSVLKGVAYQRAIKSDFCRGIHEFKPKSRIYLRLKSNPNSSRNVNSLFSPFKQTDEERLLLELRHWAAVTIQRKFRKRRLRLVNELFTLAAIAIQSFWRSYRSRSRILESNEAAIIIQSFWRGYISRKVVMVMHLAVIIIQTRWRGYVCREKYLLMRDAVILIQAVWRGYSTRWRIRELQNRVYCMTKLNVE